ncbi:MAG: AAA family ATPase [Acidobacteriota bacterium]
MDDHSNPHSPAAPTPPDASTSTASAVAATPAAPAAPPYVPPLDETDAPMPDILASGAQDPAVAAALASRSAPVVSVADEAAQHTLPGGELPQVGAAPIDPGPAPPHAPPIAPGPSDAVVDLASAVAALDRLRRRVGQQVLGRDDVIDLVLIALVADGHVLLEDYPGSGKTTLAKTLGSAILGASGDQLAPFRRIQFTPDLLPSDITGVSIFDADANQVSFRPGPLFAHVVLADEINRTSPKVQAAMLEAMAEKQITADNVTYPLDDLFFVIATQNPLDLTGTYPLPVPQLDRFLFKIRMEHIERDAELVVLETYRSRRANQDAIAPVRHDQVLAARRIFDEQVAIDRSVMAALVDVARALRDDERVLQGNSTRSLVLMLPALQVLAAIRGRDYVNGEDILTLAPRVLEHRLTLGPGVDRIDAVLADALEPALETLARATLKRRA